MNLLLVGDPHLTDRPRDAYRFGLFKWLVQQQKKYQVDVTYILGDLADQKDRHSATLVNRTIDEIRRLKPPVEILMGNHDYLDPSNPFFKFLGLFDGIRFVVEPVQTRGTVMIPHIREEQAFIDACHRFKPGKTDLLLVHNTFEGAIAETGRRLSGFGRSPIDYLAPRLGCYAGDVHRPQVSGPVTYVGAPYHVRFGDNYDPRVILLKDGRPYNLYFDCPHKWGLTVEGAEDILGNDKLLPDDQVKIKLKLFRHELADWKQHKQQVLDACKKRGLEVFGVDLLIENSDLPKAEAPDRGIVSRADIFQAFCKAEKVPGLTKQTGLKFLES